MGDQEFTVRIPPRNEKKNYHIMKFNANLKVDAGKWTQVRMVRENNKKEKAQQEEAPEFGAGSEYGKAQREEARRKKYGYISKKYNPDAQPWLMRVGNKKEGKHYRGVREGGVSENTCYYVFTHAQDGSFEAHPIKEWYNFTPRVSYKTLDAEEAEEKFAERGKILNHWAMMVNKKLKPDQDIDGDDLDGDGPGKKSKKDQKAAKSLKISDMDDWADSDENDSDDGVDKGSDDDRRKNKNKDSKAKKKKSKEDVENERDDKFEDSDDGDNEDREVDYISDESSEDEEEKREEEEKGVDQAKALSKLLDSDESSSEDENKKSEDEDGDDEDETGKKKKKKKGEEAAEEESKTKDMPDGAEDEKAKKAEKRKALVDNILDPNATGPSAKKGRMDPFPQGAGQPQSSGATPSGIESSFEEDVRRYLMRKPMTTTEILKKIKAKRTGIQKDELMPLLVSALKRINPHKQKVKGTMYLSIKPTK